MKNIVLVKSPLQLLNAIEARHHFELEDKDCFLLLMSDSKNYDQMMRLINASEQWSNIVLLSRVGLMMGNPWSLVGESPGIEEHRKSFLRSSIFTVRRLNRLARAIGDVDKIIIGDNNNPYMRHFVNTVKHKHTILLDDGTATLEIARHRLQGVLARTPNRMRKKIRLAAKRMLQKLNDKQPAAVDFFTAYNIEVIEPDRVTKNDFFYLRQHAHDLQASDLVYFIGSPLSEVGLMDESSYLEQLAMVRAEYSDKEFVYVSHRRENRNKLDMITKFHHIRVCQFDYPIEYQVAIVGPCPATIASFITSALENLSIILGDSVQITSFHLIDGTYTDRERIDAVYTHLQLNSSKYFQVKMLR